MVGEIIQDDINDGQVAYYQNKNSLLDFDAYQYDKEGQTLKEVVDEEVKEYKGDDVKTQTINEIEVNTYKAKEEYEGKEYDTLTCVFENKDDFVEIVFWLDGTNTETQANSILTSLMK